MYFSTTAKSFGFLALFVPLSVSAQSTFNLLAYGTAGGISAASLFYQDGDIMVSNLTAPPNLTPVYFTSQSNTPSAWTVQPNKTADPDASFTSGYVRLKDSTNYSLVGVGNTTDDALDLLLFGESVWVPDGDNLKNPFYGLATNTPGIWQLVWSPEDTQADQQEPVILRSFRVPGPMAENNGGSRCAIA
ncbi:hypothetical protein MY10362_004686 [Beauveria mimosiformis]